MPARQELPDTLKRSPGEAQETWIKARGSAVEQYGEGERAQRTAHAALKHSFEKGGDHWEPKAEKGPSDAQAAHNTPSPARPLKAWTPTPPSGISMTSRNIWT